jgi:ABC-type bacteriocin/lantibiotic exporter with double-glycine peptidase domain
LASLKRGTWTAIVTLVVCGRAAGVIIAFVYSWQLTLVVLGTVPFMVRSRGVSTSLVFVAM